jgi:hypothetical protein
MATPNHLQRATPQYDDFTIEGADGAGAAAISQRSGPSSTSRAARPAGPAPYVPPVDRRQMDKLRPAFYLILAGAFFALSVISTVAQVGKILALGGLELQPWQAIVAGAVVAALITAGELMTGEGLIYFCFLIPDVALTVWWLWPVLLNWSEAAGAAGWGAAVGGMALGILSAWIPERVVLGARRRQAR